MKLVLWSGGCDSTLLLYETAKAEAEGRPVRALSVVHPNVTNSGGPGEAARKNLLPRLRKRGLRIEHSTLTLSRAGDFGIEPPEHLGQPLLWLSAAVSYLGPKDDLCLAYVRSDDAMHYKAELLAAFEALQAVRGHRGKLLFPLEWHSKADVVRQLKHAGLYSGCWWCEDPKSGKRGDRPCGECVPCLTHRTALWQLRHLKLPPAPTLSEIAELKAKRKITSHARSEVDAPEKPNRCRKAPCRRTGSRSRPRT